MAGRCFILMIVICLSALYACDLSGEQKPYPEDGYQDDDSDSSDDDSCVDKDGDDWCQGQDCNDSDGSIHPGSIEQCYDFVDNDCDFMTDEDDPDCDSFGDDDGDFLFVF